jgi:hypothetical protein
MAASDGLGPYEINRAAKPSINLNIARKSQEFFDWPNKNLCGKHKH